MSQKSYSITIDTGIVPPDEYRKELQSAILALVKKPFKERKAEFEEEETTRYYFLLDFLARILE